MRVTFSLLGRHLTSLPLCLSLVSAWMLGSTGVTSAAAAGGSIKNHLTLDLNPLIITPNNPIGSGFGLSYDRYHTELKCSYALTIESSFPFSSNSSRVDLLASLGFFTEITRAFSVGARVGVVTNNPDRMIGIGALALRLPALYPDDKKFFSFFFEEIDLGVSGIGSQFACFRLGMLLL